MYRPFKDPISNINSPSKTLVNFYEKEIVLTYLKKYNKVIKQ